MKFFYKTPSPTGNNKVCEMYGYLCQHIGPDSVVGTATGFGLDGPGIESRWEGVFPHGSSRALGPTQPPVQWVRVFPGGKERPGRDAKPSSPSRAVVMKGQSYTSTPPMGRTACREPQCLYKGALYLFLCQHIKMIPSLQPLSECRFGTKTSRLVFQVCRNCTESCNCPEKSVETFVRNIDKINFPELWKTN